MEIREQLHELLSEYVEDTLIYIQTVRDFCDKQQNWTLQRKTNLRKIRNISDRADKICLKFQHVTSSNKKAKAFGEYVWSGLTRNKADSKYQKLEKELGDVLKDTLEGLEKLDHFLDAVEKLTVTSLFVFTGRSVLQKGESPESVQSVITAARMASPLLIHFKRNAETFFFPSLNNLDVLAFQLDTYICITEQICQKMKWKKGDPLKVTLNMTLRENTIKNMLDHLNQLSKIRMDQNIRMTFIFQKHTLRFIGIFSQCRSRMEQCLSDLEERAVQLDRMKMGAIISTVAGSSVGIAAGVLSIVGLALAPVTAGVSLSLTVAGLSLRVTSGFNSLVTGITEAGVNTWHGEKAQNIFQRYMDDVGKIVNCLEQASSEEHVKWPNVVEWFLPLSSMVSGFGVGKNIDSLVDAASALQNVLKTEEVITTATKVGLQDARCMRNIPSFPADPPDIGQLVKGTPLALSKTARAGFITLNALFIGLDVLFICKDAVSLAKGSKSEASQLIRSRAALWKSELEAWQKIHDSLCIGIGRFRKSKEVLEQFFWFQE